MIKKLKFWITCKRIGQDIPLTYPLLHSKILNKYLCRKKFKKFGEGSEFRIGAYAIETDKISIGNYVTIRPGNMLFASPDNSKEEIHIIIEDHVLIGSGVHIYVSNHNFSSTDTPIYFPVTILRGRTSKVKRGVLDRGKLYNFTRGNCWEKCGHWCWKYRNKVYTRFLSSGGFTCKSNKNH